MERRFKYDLATIYNRTNILAREYKAEGKTEMEKHFILVEFLEVTEELIKNQCQKFLKGRTTSVTTEDLYAIAITEPLIEVLEWFDFEQGENIVVAWISFMEKRFCNALKEGRSVKAIWEKRNVYSADKPLNEEGTTIVDLIGEDDFSDSTCTKITFQELVDKFEEKDKFGKIIRCLLIGNQGARTEAFLEVLGADSYGDTERKAVQRVKERFIKFLMKNNYDLTGYDLKKFI